MDGKKIGEGVNVSLKVSIADEVLELVPDANLGILSYSVEVEKSRGELLAYFNETVTEISSQLEISEIANLPRIKETREAYKALGKSPSQYRNASEAMLRRVVKGNGLYQINNVVDIQNIISIRSGFSIGSYDQDKLEGDIQLRKAPAGERYDGIGKSDLNIENLPTLFDDRGAFGNPTSDSKRAIIQEGKRRIMSVVYAFTSELEELEKWLVEYEERLRQFTNVTDIDLSIINS